MLSDLGGVPFGGAVEKKNIYHFEKTSLVGVYS
jgi:hypothetical protein